jgi:NADP-dependent 3-hydroxy acid dehydrogenase YdfG
MRCVVTGASQGLGYAIAREMLTLGATVLLVGRSAQKLRDAQNALADETDDKTGDACFCFAADVATDEGRASVLEHVEKLFGSLDVLVNNVGVNRRAPIEEVTGADYDLTVRTNQDSAFFLCQQFFPMLRRSSAASVVNVASVAGVRSTGTGVLYAMTKVNFRRLAAPSCEALTAPTSASVALAAYILACTLRANALTYPLSHAGGNGAHVGGSRVRMGALRNPGELRGAMDDDDTTAESSYCRRRVAARRAYRSDSPGPPRLSGRHSRRSLLLVHARSPLRHRTNALRGRWPRCARLSRALREESGSESSEGDRLREIVGDVKGYGAQEARCGRPFHGVSG